MAMCTAYYLDNFILWFGFQFFFLYLIFYKLEYSILPNYEQMIHSVEN